MDSGVSTLAQAHVHYSIGQSTAFSLLMLALLMGLGHVFPNADLYSYLPGTGVAIPTVMAFGAIAASLLVAYRRSGIAGAMTSRSTAGQTGLRLVVIGFSAVAALTGAVLLAHCHHFFDAETAVLLVAWGALGLLGVTLWALAIVVDRAEYARLGAESEQEEVRRMVAAALTHDLRSPLHSAAMAAQLLVRLVEEPKAASALQRLQRSHRRLDRLLRSLLDSLAIESGWTLSLQPNSYSFEELVQEVISENQSAVGGRVQLAGTADGLWDREALFRVVENLLLNALKYGANGPVECRIKSNVGGNASVVSLEVQNNGLPIPSSEWDAIFQPFTRGERADQVARTGWGVGLAYARLVASAHGGSIRVAASDSKGTVFELRLPQDSRPFLTEVGPA